MQAEVYMMKVQNKHTHMRFGSCSCFNYSLHQTTGPSIQAPGLSSGTVLVLALPGL